MPDGDKVHDTLPGRWQPIYQRICEGHFAPDQITRDAVVVLKREIQQLGNAPFEIIIRFAEELQRIPTEPLFMGRINWEDQYRHLAQIMQSVEGNKRAKEIAGDACKAFIQDLRLDYRCPKDFAAEIRRKYILKVYSVCFEGRVPQTKEHCNGMNQESVRLKLAEMRPCIERAIDNFAVDQKGNIRFRRRGQMQKETIDIYADLLQVGR